MTNIQARLQKALNALQAVLDLHKPEKPKKWVPVRCNHCRTPHPCPTVEAIQAVIGAEPKEDEIIEQAARVLTRLEPGGDWPTNETLGGGLTGTRDDEFRQEMIDQARALADAGLLTRDNTVN